MREDRLDRFIERWGWLMALAVCSAVAGIALFDAFDAGAALGHPLWTGSSVFLGLASGLTLAVCIPLMLLSVTAETRRMQALRKKLERKRGTASRHDRQR
jgi:hypothetical protein